MDFERWQDYSPCVGRHLGDKTVKKDKRPDSYQSPKRGVTWVGVMAAEFESRDMGISEHSGEVLCIDLRWLL